MSVHLYFGGQLTWNLTSSHLYTLLMVMDVYELGVGNIPVDKINQLKFVNR